MSNKLSILQMVLHIGPTSAPYNELTLHLYQNHRITLVSYYPPTVEPPKELHLATGTGGAREFLLLLVKLFRQNKFDIIHVHASHIGLFLGLAALVVGPRLLSCSVFTVHSSLYSLTLRNRLFLVFCLLLFKHIVFCSHSSYESFPAWIHWLVRKKYTVITNGVDIQRIDNVLKQQDSDNKHSSEDSPPLNMIVVGRLIAVKNPVALLHAFSAASQSQDTLVFLGEGDLLKQLTSEAISLGVPERIAFPGIVQRNEVFKMIRESSLFVSASFSEGMPVAVLEAMAVGCPVILSDIPSHREIARYTQVIPLVAPKDVDGFAREIKRFRDLPYLEQQRIGRECRRVAVEHFSLNAMLQAYDDLYFDIAQKDSDRSSE